MKLTVHNLGPITEGTVDFKPLTIFVGPNNTGKTYVAYLAYALTSKRRLVASSLPECRKQIQNLVSNLFQEADVKFFLKNLSISKTFKIDDILTSDNIRKLINSLLGQDIPNKVFPQLFGVSQFQQFKLSMDHSEIDNLVKTVQVKMEDIDVKGVLSDNVYNIRLQIPYTKPAGSKFVKISVFSEISDLPELDEFIKSAREPFEYSEEPHKTPTRLDEAKVSIIFQEYLPEVVLPDLILDNIFIPAFTQSLYNNVIVFPIYRHAFALSSVRFQLDFARSLSIFKALYYQLVKQGTDMASVDSFPGVIDDYISLLNELASAATSSREGMPSLAKMAEILLLEGNHIELRKESRSGACILYSQGDTTLELERSSSMVQQLSPLILYLKFLAKKGDLVIIDEPESNLHPEAQLRIAQLIARMVNNGLNVVITTHSPYIAEYINMLIDAYNIARELEKSGEQKEEIETKIKKVFEGTLNIPHPGSIWDFLIPPEKVSAYFFGNSTIRSLKESQGDFEGFDWKTFAKVSEKIDQLYDSLVLLDIHSEPQ